MRINPVGYGKNNNLHVTARGEGFTFKMVLFFDNGFAFVTKATKRVDVPHFDLQNLYKNMKASLDKMDFILITPPEKILNPSMTQTENIRNFIRDKYNDIKIYG